MSFRRLDLQEAGKLTFKFSSLLGCQENIFRKLKFKIPKIDRVNFLQKKSKQIFSQKINKLSSKFRLIFINWLWSQIKPLLSNRRTGAEINDFKELD